MRIGIDALAVQSPYSRGRGIGRYARSLLADLLDRDRSNDYVIYTYEDLPLDDLPTAPRAEVRNVRRRFDRGEHTLEHAARRVMLEDPDRLDWMLLLSPFETWQFYGLPPRPPRGPKMAAVLYDLIPFLFQETYLDDESVGRWFYGHLEQLARYDLLLAISEATRRDALRLLGLPDSRVVTIGTASFPIAPGAGPDLPPSATLDRLGIDRPYLFCLGSSDPRKNLSGMLDAFALLPARYRDAVRLVITCALTEEEIGRVLGLAREAGVADSLVLTNAVGDRELRVLYEHCLAFVFPSHYEGFGLPILEAMQHGAPVIAGDNSSQPEVIGDAGLLVDTGDPAALAREITRLLDDRPLRDRLSRSGIERATLFRWSDVADRTLGAIESASRPSRRRSTGSDRLAIFAPLPPIPSGISRYTERLCERLREEARLDLYHDDDYRPTLADGSGRVAGYPAPLFRRRSQLGYANVLYQFGNSSYHCYMYRTFLERPGVVVLHDEAMTGFHASFSLYEGGRSGHLQAELDHDEPAADAEVRALVASWSPGTWDLPEELVRRGILLNRRILERATGVIVHSQAPADRIAARYPWLAGKVRVAPIAAEPRPVLPDQRRAARHALGLDPSSFVAATVGILHPTKLNRETLRAFAALLPSNPDATLLCIGRDLGGGEARREADRLGIAGRVRFLGHLADADYERALHAIDLGIGLRRPPTNGESSASLLDLLRLGLPTVVVDVGSFAELPGDAVFKLRWPDADRGTAALADLLRAVAADPDRRRAVGRNALRHVEREHSWDRLLAVYRELCFPGRSAGRPWPVSAAA